MKFLRQTIESFRFAWQALVSNILRTTLSLLGVTIGIFSIIAVLTMVDSLERNIKESLADIGTNVLYVQKWPWIFGGEYQWWKYFQRPEPTYTEYKFLKDNLENAETIVAMDAKNNVTVKNGSNSYSSTLIQGVSFEYDQISEVAVQHGRYFLPQEVDGSRLVAIIGSDITEALFPNVADPTGLTFKLRGLTFVVVGVTEKKGKGLLDITGNNPDVKCLIPYGAFAKLFQSFKPSIDIVVKGREKDEGLAELEAEITGLLRSRRGIKPVQDVNFAINRPEAATKAISGIFTVLTLAGWIIGSFSMLVGGFGIANIMFVSVKERTNLIGIQKSLGAKNYFILFQFLFEAVLLSLVGGLVGLLLVYGMTFVKLGSLEVVLSANNVILGLGVSSIIGIVAGIVPALLAARMDPVIAIRAK